MSGGDIVAAVIGALKANREVAQLVGDRVYRGALPPNGTNVLPVVVVALVSRTRRNIVNETDHVEARVQLTIIAESDATRCRLDDAVVLALNRNPGALRLAGLPWCRACSDAGCQVAPPSPGGTIWSISRDFLIRYF